MIKAPFRGTRRSTFPLQTLPAGEQWVLLGLTLTQAVDNSLANRLFGIMLHVASLIWSANSFAVFYAGVLRLDFLLLASCMLL